jgi:tetratricopeptide (TPR) repeat protein
MLSASPAPQAVPMTRPWCSERLLLIRVAGLLIGLTLLASPAWGHPELLAQIELLDTEIQQQPGNAELLIRRGDLYRREQDYSAAQRDFAAARKLQPDNSELDFFQGRLQLERGDFAAADLLLSHYLAAHPEHASAWALRGRTRLSLDLPLEAAQDYAQAIAHSDAPSPSLYREQVLALVAAGEGYYITARKMADAGLDRFPGEVSLLGLATDIALAEDEPGAAALYMQRLPAPISLLPAWQARRERAQCLVHGDQPLSPGRAQCHQAAIKSLQQPD